MTTPDTTMIDGVEYLSLATLGELCGVDLDEARAEHARQDATHPGRFVIPRDWRRGAKELQAKHGTTDMGELLARIRATSPGGGQ